MAPCRQLPLALLLLLAAAAVSRACTTLAVGGAATNDGSIYITRTEDTPFSNITQNLYYHPARGEPFEFRTRDNNLTVLLEPPLLQYIAVPVSTSEVAGSPNPTFEEVGINSAGVALSSTETIFSSDAATAADPLNTATGLLEDNIASIILPQATSAREGVELLGKYVEDLGSAEGFGIQFADRDEAWYFENIAGHHWVAHRIPDDAFFVAANQGRLQVANLSDTANVLSSPGLEAFAQEAGLWDPARDGPLNTFKAFMLNVPSFVSYDFHRVCELQRVLGDHEPPVGTCAPDDLSCRCVATGGMQPMFLPPAEPLNVTSVFNALRNHYDGTEHDPYMNRNPAEPWRPIAVLRTGMAHVTRMRSRDEKLPDALSATNYVSMSMPLLAPFVPIYKGVSAEGLPPEMTNATASYDPTSLFWRARRLQVLVFQDFPRLGPPAVRAIQDWEAAVEAKERPAMEAEYIEKWEAGDKEGAQEVLDSWTRDVAADAGKLLDRLAEEAAESLGMNDVPDKEQVESMLFDITTKYLFHHADN